MANEVPYDFTSGETLYHTRFQLNGDVFITDGSSDESWGAGSADDYDVTMPEKGSSGHYVGDFDTSANIAAGEYRVTIRLQAGVNPADSDLRIARGTMYWDGTAEISILTLDTTIEDDVIGADGDTLKDLSDEIAAIDVIDLTAVNDHLVDIKGTGFVADTDSLVDLAHTGADDDTLEDLSDQLDGLTSSAYRNTNKYGPGE